MTQDEIISLMREKTYKPMNDESLGKHFNVHGKDAAEMINQIDEMVKKGVISKTAKDKYVLSEKLELYSGYLSKNQRGFGFMISEIEDFGDIFIPPGEMNGAMNGDRILVKISKKLLDQKKSEGSVVKILERANDEIVGNFRSSEKYGFVIADSKKLNDDIYISKKDFNGAKNDDKVVVQITKWPEKDRNAEGRIIEIIGSSKDKRNDAKGLIRQYSIKEDFPDDVLLEANSINETTDEKEIESRRDLRGKTIITIDGEDAKDLDDAVCVEKLENGNYRLGVHIADVSHYVPWDSKLDQEALRRGCSIYLIDKVIPMLPQKLSNGICSLNPKINRLTLSIEMEIDKSGKVVSYEIFKSVINTTERMVYTDVSDILENNDKAKIDKYSNIYKNLLEMNELGTILERKRNERGYINFDVDEAVITLDETGNPISVELAERRIANRLIEEFMLAANETIAEHIFWMDLPFVYRVHESPSMERIEEFKNFIQSLGYSFKGSTENVHPKVLNDILEKIKGRPEEHVISTVMLRSMKKAAYSVECQGHFGLGVKYYCHFTSPIRRYPDLIIHRIIKMAIKMEITNEKQLELMKKCQAAAEISSIRERISEELEREIEKLKMTEYMEKHIGEEFSGVISGVIQSGFFVELPNTIEGMVRIDTISNDYYIFEAEKYRFIGERTKKIYRIGDNVKIKVLNANSISREIDFVLV
ncbi:MAG: ribonuclease R [Eubacteriales bacterium]